MQIPERIKQYLKEHGIKQGYLANKSNINEKTLSALLQSRIKMSIDRYLAICQALDVPESYFFKNQVQESGNNSDASDNEPAQAG